MNFSFFRVRQLLFSGILLCSSLVIFPAFAQTVCGNPRAQVNFTPYTGIPAADQNSSTNAWDSITLGNKMVVGNGIFFDITDGINAIDDGAIVSAGLQNFAVSRHNGYIEFLALGRRLSTYYGYYQGTIKFENVQVDRVEPGLTTATWADIGLEAIEGDAVTKVSDNEVSFKLAFANQGDGFRVYLKNPTPTECTCPAGQEKKPDPKSPVCIVRALVKGVQDTEFILTGYDHLAGNCTLAAGTPQAPQTPSTEITVTAGQQRTSWMQGSPWAYQLDPLLTCPAGTTKTACMFTYGAGPLGEITCGCYPNENTNTPKNLSCQTFTNPMLHGKPVHSRSGSPEQFCREQGYSQSATVGANESNFIGNLSKWNGSVWEINPDGLVINSVSCCKLEDKSSNICVNAGCTEGQYWCQEENVCKPAGQSCSTITCNNNNTCEAGESCNCGDCTNGGTDDADKCGLSNNAQMVCTKDVKNTTTALTPTTQKWVAYTYPGYASSYIYISKLPTETHTVGGQTFYVYNPERVIRGMSEATFMANPEEAIKNAPVIPVGNTRWTERLIFNIAQLQSETSATQTATINALTSSVAHRYMCTENAVGATNCSNNSDMGWTPSFGKAQGGDIYVSASNSGGGVAFAKGQILGTFDVANTTCQPYTTSSLRYVPNTDPRTQGWLNINGIGTAQNDGGKSVWQVNDGGNDSGDNAVVYKKFTTTELNDFFTRGGKYSVELKNISASAPTSGAAYLLASYLEIARGANTAKGARRFTFVFGLDADKTPTIIGLNNNGTTYIAPSNSTYKYRVDGGANKYNTYEMIYDPATDTVDMFVNGVERISNFPGNTVAPGYATAIRDTAAIIFGSGTSPGVANTNYGNISVTIKNNCPGSTVQVGACCPAGAQWDSSQGKCLTACEPIVTLKKGADLTTIKNPQGEAFSTNTTCANKNISLSPCNTTMGVVADGTSPSGNKLYKWPKTASGLSKDYNLVEINGQCWFADNVEENSTTWPAPVNTWDNNSPHNGYGIYSYAGTGVNRPEGYLYQFDAATNNPAPASAPAGSLQGVCPAGWHVATDCEYQYLEHTLGMTVTEQQAVGVRTSGAVGTAMKSGGNSGFDMPLSGARRYNTGFINGGSEGHLWSTDCDASAWPAGGCYKRILNVTDGNITRIKGDGGTYDSAHHAAGSVRCVKDGSTTPVNTCPVPGCAEGEYYCHAELKCKPANEACQAVVCEDKKVFTYTGIVQNYTVPTDVSKIEVKAWGAGGGGTILTSSLGGVGAYAFVSLPVVAGENYKVVVGEGGKGSVTIGTFGGGGAGGLGYFSGGAGGGLSGIFKTTFTQPNALLVAGGGGGASGSCGHTCVGGNGGGPNGGNGMSVGRADNFFYPGQGGRGGVLNGAGLGGDVYGTAQDGMPGVVMQGGVGGLAYTNLSMGFGGGGGGGGGYYGGGGGSGDTNDIAYSINYTNDATGGGGSSSCPTINASGDCIVQAGTGSTVPKNTDVDYKAGVGAAGMYTVAGGNGLVVITECRPKSATTCNNNSVCDTNESCDCADCNEQVDHCGIDGLGQQMICTKDTAEKCYTDKFPYCLSGCLDGYKMDVGGQCVQNFPASTSPVTPSTGSQNFSYPVKIDGYVKNDAASATKFCTEKGFTSATIVSSDSSGARKMGWNGISWVADNSGGSYIKLLTCSGGTPQNYTCQSYTGNIQTHGGYLSIQPQSTTQFCKEAGYDFPQLTSQYSTSSSCRLWNGTSWYEDVACVAASGLQCCTNPTAPTNQCITPKMKVNFTRTENVPNSIILGSGTVLANNPTFDLTQIGTPIFDATLVDTTTHLAVRRQSGYVEFMARNPTATNAYYTGTITLENATVDRVEGGLLTYSDPGYGLEAVDNDFATKTSSTVVNFQMAFTYPGDGFRIYYTMPSSGALCSGATSTEPQLGACCPPGSAWNSVENRCIPTTCGEGQFYCAAQKKCLAGGQTCDTAVCNNDGVCSGEESCQCGDCVNGGGDDKDKCSIVGGTQAMCSDDDLGDGKPGACCVPPKKWNTATSSCVECSNTQAPSELKAGVDQPYITCTGNGDTTKTHFKYRITKQGTTDAPFISELYTVGTSVLHPTMTLGDYTVECFYGNATGVDASATATPHSCVKTMSVKSDAQGCSRVYPYKGSTLSDEMTSASAFDASFRCGSRKPVAGAITNPYMFRVGTQAPSYLSFDALISELFNGLTIGPVSTQTQNYNFNTGNTDVICATKVGGGYSTNTACQLRTCVGGACNVPQTFSVVHSDDLICTTEETSTYNIGCNPAAPDSVRNQCIQWFRDAVNAGSRNVSNGVEFNVSFAFNADTPTNVTCIKYVAGQMPGGLNLSDNVVCRATLKNGERYQIYAADTNGRIDALQTTAKTVERDREAPTMAEVKYYTDETLTTEVPSTNWYNKPVIALAVCSDTPLNEATSCACAQRVDTTTTDADAWSLGVPNSLIGADLMRYTRTIAETLTGTQKVQVVDTAGNTSTAKNIAVSLDTQAPLVTPTESGTGTTRTITLTASDTGSKIWKTTAAPSGATNTSGIIYRVGPKADMATLAFDAACNTTPTYATVTETQSSSFPSQATATISNLNTATQVVAYCVRDNAGNTTRGMYPVITDACFSATNMPTIPTFDTYKSLLKTRLTATGTDNQKYGYSFSENTADASCFRGILSNNITTLMTNQLKPRTATTLSNWDLDRAELSTSTTLSNGYYYYVYPTSNTLNIVTSPTGGAPVKSVVVDGGDIRIKTDINYSGAGKTLLLIARKNSNGQGGNIIIDTNVKNIDAILIADGGALRSSDATLPGERLTINGRLYSYNTRGGSLTVSGTDFVDSTTPKKFTNSSLVSASSLNDARIQDLERFRPLFADGNNACSLVVNHQVFTTANLPALLKRPSTFTGGSCGF